jgi:hypothetical protein
MTPIVHNMECLECKHKFTSPMPTPCIKCGHKYLIDHGFKKDKDE